LNFENDFKDKVVIVTGGAGGLGKEAAMRFASCGARVIVCDVKTKQGKETADAIAGTGAEAKFIETDISREVSVVDMVKTTLDIFGAVDILINSAGLAGKGLQNFRKIPVSEWDLTYQVNLKGTVNCCRAVYEIFKKRKSGKIINIASISGQIPTPGLIHYGASKAGVISLTQNLALELAPYNVNVNAVCPGWIWTPLYSEGQDLVQLAQKRGTTPRKMFEDIIRKMCPMQREQTEADVANAILFLASEAARSITGQSLNVDGGAVMH